ncbi:MAG: eIF2A-related protein [Bacillota bacterium]
MPPPTVAPTQPPVPPPTEPKAEAGPAPTRLACGEEGPGKPLLPGATGQVDYLCDGQVWAIDLATGRQTRLVSHAQRIADFAWEPGGSGIAVVTESTHEVLFWDAATQELHPVMIATDVPNILSWSPTGEILVVSPGTDVWRSYQFIARKGWQLIGEASGMGLRWSPDGRRFATVHGVDVPEYPVQNGASSTLIVGEIDGIQVATRTVATGDAKSGWRDALFTEDSALVYRELNPRDHQQSLSWWLLPPGPQATPRQLEPDSPLIRQAEESLRRPVYQVDGQNASRIGLSPDGKWALILFRSLTEVYLIDAALTGERFLLPGGYHEWVPAAHR